MKTLKKYFIKSFSHFKGILPRKYGWFGNFYSWSDAQKGSVGYDSDEIIRKVYYATNKVKRGEAAYERDSVLFFESQYSMPLLAYLMLIAAKEKEGLHVLDYGGSLGSTYFQNRKILDQLPLLTWNVVEQKSFVSHGKREFSSKTLKFHDSIDDCLSLTQINTILFSSVLQYLEAPFSLLNSIIRNKSFKYVILDLTGILIENTDDIITIQKVSPLIYTASYPCWLFNESKLLSYFSKEFILRETFYNQIGKMIKVDGKNVARYKGYVFQRKTAQNKNPS